MKRVFIQAKDDGELYVKASCSGIHPVVILCDGIPTCWFGSADQHYLAVKDVIAWYAAERVHGLTPFQTDMAREMARIYGEFKAKGVRG